MRKKYLLVITAVFLYYSSNGQLQNINISNAAAFDGEPYLAVNPVNPDNMVIAWMGYALVSGVRISIKSKESFDGGRTWSNQVVHPHYCSGCGSADVSMSFRKDGVLFMSYIDYRQSPDSGVIYSTSSADGGATWTNPVIIWNAMEDTVKEPIDRPWIAVDNSLTANGGMLYITTKPAPWIAAPNRPYLKASTDSGQTWSAYRYVDTTGFLVGSLIKQPMAALATTADGALCIAYPSYDIAQSVHGKYFLAKSYNQAASFQYYDLLIDPIPVADTLYKLGYRLAANPANANQLAFAYIGGQNGDPDVFVNTSNDGGQTWGGAVRVNDDAPGNGKAQDMVWISYNEAGVLAAVWRDRRNGTDTGFYQPSDTYFAVSHDNGASFQANIRLSTVTAPFDSVLMLKGNDFMCNHLAGDSLCAAWGDVRSGKLNIYFAKTSDSTGLGTGIIHVTTEDSFDFDVYPNPASNTLTISLSRTYGIYGLPARLNSASDGQLTLKLTDMNGNLIYKQKIQSEYTTVKLNDLSKGVYFLAIEGDGYSLGKKVLKAD